MFYIYYGAYHHQRIKELYNYEDCYSESSVVIQLTSCCPVSIGKDQHYGPCEGF